MGWRKNEAYFGSSICIPDVSKAKLPSTRSFEYRLNTALLVSYIHTSLIAETCVTFEQIMDMLHSDNQTPKTSTSLS